MRRSLVVREVPKGDNALQHDRHKKKDSPRGGLSELRLGALIIQRVQQMPFASGVSRQGEERRGPFRRGANQAGSGVAEAMYVSRLKIEHSRQPVGFHIN